MKSIHLTEEEKASIRAMAERIEKNIKYHYRIPDLAASIHMNEKKFKEGFRLLFGKPPYQFLLEHRLEYAKEQLLHQSILRAVALAVGFSGRQAENNFIKFFKKMTGTTPASWRRLQEEKRKAV